MKSTTPAVLLVLFVAACESNESSLQTQKKMAAMTLEQGRRDEAELMVERNGPRIASGDYRRLEAAVAFKREKEQLELAEYARFQMQQKIALAQASSPRMVITKGDEVPSDYRQVEYTNGMDHRDLSYSRKQGFVGAAYSAMRKARDQNYPARFYVRQLQEDSAAQAQMQEQQNQLTPGQEINPDDVPYAIPVPGRPGYVTMPPKIGGYIDVRGYAPGSMVMDPWTKTIIRVP